MQKHEKNHPIVCEVCGADLCEPDSIVIHFSDGEKEVNTVKSCVNNDGHLVDPTGQVMIGMHAGSYCAACDELLDELLDDID